MKISLYSGPGTRRWDRFRILDVPWIRGIKSAAGHRIDVLDISRGGARLLTRRPLVPGTSIRLEVITSGGCLPVTGLVLRSSDFSAANGSLYQAAVSFDSPLPMQFPDHCPVPVPNQSQPVTKDYEEISPAIANFLAIDLSFERDAGMQETLALNDW